MILTTKWHNSGDKL